MAIVTGASRGLGRAIAVALAAAGADVALAARSRSDLEENGPAGGAAGRALVAPADVSRLPEMQVATSGRLE